MIEPIKAQLDKMESMNYEGLNADALREMDFNDLRDLVEDAQNKSNQAYDMHIDTCLMVETVEEELQVLKDQLDNLQTIIKALATALR